VVEILTKFLELGNKRRWVDPSDYPEQKKKRKVLVPAHPEEEGRGF
jgi:hypothetical protein